MLMSFDNCLIRRYMLAAGLPGIFSLDKIKSKDCPRVCKKRSHNLLSSVVETSDAAVTTSFRSGLYRSLKFLYV